MSIQFASKEIPGDVLPFQPESPGLQTWRTKYVGVFGVSEIVGETGSRSIEIPFLLHKGTATRQNGWRDPADLQQFLDVELINLQGENDELSLDSSAGHGPYAGCTFDGFKMVMFPLLDVAGTIDGGWHCIITLCFTQLAPRTGE